MVVKFKEFSLVVEQIGNHCLARVRRGDLSLVEGGKQKNMEENPLMNHLDGEGRSITYTEGKWKGASNGQEEERALQARICMCRGVQE